MWDHIRIAGLILLLVFDFQPLLLSFPLSVEMLQANTKQQRNQLQLEVETISQRFCEFGDSRAGNLQLDFQLLFTNSSEDHLILYKFIRDIIRFMISRSLEDMEAGRFEVDATQTIMTISDNPLKADGNTFDKYFTTLAPGESYKSKARLLIPISQNTYYKKSGYLTAGQYVLQIKVRTWPDPDISHIEFKEQWRNLGKLWSDHITSLPMRFEISDKYEGENCYK